MIGPHEGKELDLMLAGEKALAVFHDAVPAEGGMIAETIIPEQAFAPHVVRGTVKRFAEDIQNVRSGGALRFVCFTLPGEEWRAQFFLWFKREWLGGRQSYDPSHEYIIGNLLGYTPEDVDDYLRAQKSI